MTDATETPIDGDAHNLSAESHQHHLLHLTILVNGEPERRTYPSHEKVELVIKSLLHPGQRHAWEQYELRERNATSPLNALHSLTEDGVRDGDTLSLTKKDGGGGVRDC